MCSSASCATSWSTRSRSPTRRRYPSTAKQLDLSRLLVEELREIGLDDVELTEPGYVFATVPGTVEGSADGRADRPRRHGAGRARDGRLARSSIAPGTASRSCSPGDPAQVLDPDDMPALADKLGHDLVTSDGTTLLGADDKAGVAIIVTAARRLLHDDAPRATARIAFTVDEEVGARHRPLRPRGVRRGPRVHVRRLGARRGRDRDVLGLPARAHDRGRRRAPRHRRRGGS